MEDAMKAFRREQSRAEYRRFGILLLVLGAAYYLSTQPVTMCNIMVVAYGLLWYQDHSTRKNFAEIERQLTVLNERLQSLR